MSSFIVPDSPHGSSGRSSATSRQSAAASSFSSGSGSGGGVGNNPQMRMRQVCCHPFIIAEPEDLAYGTTDSRIISACGKMVVLDRMLRALRAGGHKVLIFSQVRWCSLS